MQFWSITLKAMMILPRNAGNNLSFSPKRITTRRSDACLFYGTSVCKVEGTVLCDSQWVWRPLGIGMGEEQNPELRAWKLCQESAVRFYLSLDKKSVLSELTCLRNSTRIQIKHKSCFKRPAHGAHTFLTVWYGQSNHRWWPSLGRTQFSISYCPPFLSELPGP